MTTWDYIHGVVVSVGMVIIAIILIRQARRTTWEDVFRAWRQSARKPKNED